MKLGYRKGMLVFGDGMPDPIRHAIEHSIGQRPGWLRLPESGLDAVHLFLTRRGHLDAKLAALPTLIKPNGFVWISWPHKQSKGAPDLNGERIRAAILPSTDWVDVKVCVIDQT